MGLGGLVGIGIVGPYGVAFHFKSLECHVHLPGLRRCARLPRWPPVCHADKRHIPRSR